ncbi:5639_t:CDS:1, partial [Racocetra persica]
VGIKHFGLVNSTTLNELSTITPTTSPSFSKHITPLNNLTTSGP